MSNENVNDNGLLKDALEMMKKMQMLEEVVLWQYEEVVAFEKKYPDKKLDKMSGEKLDKVIRMGEELLVRMDQSVEELQKLNLLYEDIRKRAAAKFGYEVLPEQKGFAIPIPEDVEVDLTGGGWSPEKDKE